VNIRDAREQDAAAIAAIYNQAVLTSTATYDTVPQSVEARLEWLREHDERHPVIVAEDDGGVVGWASLSKWSQRPGYDRTVEISTYIDEGARGRGLGTILTQAMIDRARAIGYHAIISRISLDNERSVRMTERLGFERVGTLREVGFKFGQLLDVAIYELLLG